MAASGKAGVMDFTKQVRNMLEKHTAADLPLLSPVFLDEDVQPVDAFKFLSEHSLRACPVRYVPTLEQRILQGPEAPLFGNSGSASLSAMSRRCQASV